MPVSTDQASTIVKNRPGSLARSRLFGARLHYYLNDGGLRLQPADVFQQPDCQHPSRSRLSDPSRSTQFNFRRTHFHCTTDVRVKTPAVNDLLPICISSFECLSTCT